MSSNTSMLEVLKSLKSAIKVRKVADKAIIDGMIFKLHYRITTITLFVCCAIVTTYTMFGEPILCMSKFEDDDKKKAANTFCYLGYTYTLLRNLTVHKNSGTMEQSEENKTYYTYYRWVPFMLFLQGVLFYLPHYVWKNWEGKKLTLLTQNLRGPMMCIKPDQEKKLKLLAKYFFRSLHTHNTFALMYYFCETLNFINVIVNIYAMDAFLNGEFLKYGLGVLDSMDMHQYDRSDTMIEIFPRITKCDFSMFGPSGSIENTDILCVLALNNLNEKIYIFLWFWLIILACLSVLPIVSNFAIFASLTIRQRILEKHYISNKKFSIKMVARRAKIGDFFILDLMGRNMNSKCYHKFIDELYACLKEKMKSTL